MSGAHDLGGAHGFSEIAAPHNEAIFAHDWEERVFALTLAAGTMGKWNIDSLRFAREQMSPGECLTTSYYEHWLFGLEQLLHQSGLVSRGQMAARLADLNAPCTPRAPGLPDAPTSAAIDAAMRRVVMRAIVLTSPRSFVPVMLLSAIITPSATPVCRVTYAGNVALCRSIMAFLCSRTCMLQAVIAIHSTVIAYASPHRSCGVTTVTIKTLC